MDFISDAEMQKLESNQPKEFISDEEMTQHDSGFISDADMEKLDANHGVFNEIFTGTGQAAKGALAGLTRLVGDAALGVQSYATGKDTSPRREEFHKELSDIYGLDKNQKMETLPGMVVETAGSVAPYLANLPSAAAGVGVMYNDIVNQLVEKGIPLDKAREIALKENGAMLAAGIVGGAGTMKAGSAMAERLGIRAAPLLSKVAGGAVGGAGGAEVAREVHNAELADRPDLQHEFDSKQAVANAIAFGGIGGMHGPALTQKPKLEIGLDRDFETHAGTVSAGEFKLLQGVQKNLDDKMLSINEKIAGLEEHLERTGEATPELVEQLTAHEAALNKLVSDMTELETKLSGDVTEQRTTEKALEIDQRKQDIIQRLKELRGPKEPYVPPEPITQLDREKMDEGINKLDETVKEEPPLVGEEHPPLDEWKPPVEEVPVELSLEDWKKIASNSLQGSPVNPKDVVKITKGIADGKTNEQIVESLWEGKDRGLSSFDPYEALNSHQERQMLDYSIEQVKREYERYTQDLRENPRDSHSIPQEQKLLPVETTPIQIKNKSLPTSDEVHYLLRESKTVGDALTVLMKERVGTLGQRALMSILSTNKRVGSALFRGVKDAINEDGRVGEYNWQTHEVVLAKGGKIGTVLHEAVHAAVHQMLEEGTSHSARAIQALYERYKLDHIKKTDPTSGRLSDREKLALGHNDISGNYYGFADVHEFVTEAMTNPRFQKLLNNIEDAGIPGKIESYWNRFKAIVKKSVGGSLKVTTALDHVLEHGSKLIDESSNQPFQFKTLAESDITTRAKPSIMDEPTVRSVRGAFSRNMFGINALEGFYRDHPIVQKAFRDIRSSMEAADKITNQWLNGTQQVLSSGQVKFYSTLKKVQDKSSAAMALKHTSKLDMAVLHDLFKRGFEEKKDYAQNLADNGQHLTPDQVAVYNTFAKLFKGMYTSTKRIQDVLKKKHTLTYRDGWYPASRVGKYSVEISFNGNVAHTESFRTQLAAEQFRRKVTDGKNLQHLTVSEVMDGNKKELVQPNKEMADIIGDVLASKYPTASAALQKTIDDLVYAMQTRGGKLGYHHQHRMNVSGYKGSELFKSREDIGDSFREGIHSEVGNFGMNLRSLIIKHRVEPILSDEAFRQNDPVGHGVISQMFDSSLGRNKEFFEGVAERAANAADSAVNHITLKALGREFEGRQHVTTSVSNSAMGVFYATKMMAKLGFSVIGQIFSIPMIVPEIARDSTLGLRAYYSFAKGSTKFWTGDKALWEHLKESSQTFNTVEAQFLESMNISKHADSITRTDKIRNAVKDWILLGAVGERMDSFSRLYSYAIAYTHYIDTGLSKTDAAYQARLASDKAMNVYGSAESAPIFTTLGSLGSGMKPLSSYGLNQLGNLVSYAKEAFKGKPGALISYGLMSTLVGGVLSLPFIQEYERYRKIFSKFFDTDMPSVLEVMSNDESFLDRLNITPEDRQAVMLYGVPALSGIDLSASVRSNETLFSIAAAVVMGQEDFGKLVPIWGATGGTAATLVDTGIKAATSGLMVGDKRTAVDSVVAGHWGYGAKELLGVNKTNMSGEQTDMMAIGKKGMADRPRTPTDVAAGILGTKSIAQKYGDERDFDLTERERIRQGRIARAASLFVESPTADKVQHVKKMIDLKMSEDEIVNAIGTASFNRVAPQEIRFFINKAGTVNERKAMGMFNFGKNK